MKRSQRKIINYFVTIFAFIVLAAFILTARFYLLPKKESKAKSVESTSKTEEKPVETKPVIKESALLTVPYTVQAPLANWNVHEESCEEAALLMYHYYLDPVNFSTSAIPKERANKELIDMVTWQKTHYGKEEDLSMSKLGQLAKDYYGYQFEVKKDITETEIKTAISNGQLVIVPVMTQSLKNPHYSRGDVYHVLLIKGYDATGVIANDAGVKEGENWHYDWSILWGAIDAQTAKMNQGRVMLTLNK